MSADPTVETHPLLFAVVQQLVDYYREVGEYVSRTQLTADLKKDSQFGVMLDEAGILREHENTLRAFRRVVWPIIRHYMNSRAGWWARTYGKNASFFHQDWGTPEDLRDALNRRLRDREKDEAAATHLYALMEKKCGQLGWSFDPQFDDQGTLVKVDTWAYEHA